MIYLGLSMLMEGQYHQVVEMFQQAYASLQEPGTAYGSRLLFCLAVSHLLHGELELCRQTAELLVRNSLTFNLLLNLGWGYYLLGRVYQEWDQLELAARYYQLVVEQRFTSNLFCSLESVQGWSEIPVSSPLFESVVDVADDDTVSATSRLDRFALTLKCSLAGGRLQLDFDSGRFDAWVADRVVAHFRLGLEALLASPGGLATIHAV